ncbi:hypothetical protein [Escherichia coli]|uniref:hypothetical protein n=1 Tax=Escherichia coli TaxID=562 RepID=UPI0008FF8BDF|nr:hypothetical protein [Escherichia coli]
MIRRVSVASGICARCGCRHCARYLLPDAARAPYPTYGSVALVGLIRREQRRIRHLRTVSDAARAPYPTYSSIAWRI